MITNLLQYIFCVTVFGKISQWKNQTVTKRITIKWNDVVSIFLNEIKMLNVERSMTIDNFTISNGKIEYEFKKKNTWENYTGFRDRGYQPRTQLSLRLGNFPFIPPRKVLWIVYGLANEEIKYIITTNPPTKTICLINLMVGLPNLEWASKELAIALLTWILLQL